jgi:hypothetical protein
MIATSISRLFIWANVGIAQLAIDKKQLAKEAEL